MSSKNFREILLVFLLSRVAIFAILLCCAQAQVVSLVAYGGHNFDVFWQPFTSQGFEQLKNIFSAADARWYLNIAKVGYQANAETLGPKNWVFFPLFPLLVRVTTFVTGSYLASALLISNFAFFVSLCLLTKLLELRGSSEAESQCALS